MKKTEEVSIRFEKYSSADALFSTDANLLNQAKLATQNSYAPYSEFYVGAAMQLTDGKIILGCNQENSAFPSGLCAERVALFKYGSEPGQAPIEAIAITARSQNLNLDHPLTSCGGCLQVMIDFEMRQETPIKVIFGGETGEVWIFESVQNLIPFAFGERRFK